MIDIAHATLPATLTEKTNLPHLAAAYHRAANRAHVDAHALRERVRLGTHGPADVAELGRAEKLAQTYIATAKDMQRRMRDEASFLTKFKQPAMRAALATAVIAEIVSIPILIANCAVVARHKHAPPATVAGLAPYGGVGLGVN